MLPKLVERREEIVMEKIKKFYNPELETTDTYTEVWKTEAIKVKDESDLLVMNHYWRDKDGALWGDFNDPMENVRRSFDVYRERKGYMTPDEIRDLRNQLNMSVREFADILGISTSSLTQIENNKRIQAKYQEILFEAAKDKYKIDGKLPEDWKKDSEEPSFNKDQSNLYNVPKYITEHTIHENIQAFSNFNVLGDAA
ncbi:transcriptional regulator [Lactiplantibacillus plantarum]|nr:transcriptional regulator [Lactiplantibacillus plantarum]